MPTGEREFNSKFLKRIDPGIIGSLRGKKTRYEIKNKDEYDNLVNQYIHSYFPEKSIENFPNVNYNEVPVEMSPEQYTQYRNYEKGAGTRGMEYLESLEDITNLAKNLIENDTTIDKKNTKVGKAMLELNDIRIAEERLSNTDAAKFKPTSKDESKIPKNEGMALADFMFPPNSGKEVTLNDKNDKLKKAMLTEGLIINDTEIKSIRNNHDSKRRIVYQSLQLLNFTDNYNKTGKGFPLKTWAILNGIAYVHREADVIVLTEVQEFITNGNPNGSIKNRLHLIKKLFNIYGNWEVVEQRLFI
jgi:hypothetical protein